MKPTPEDVQREINKEIVQKVLTEKCLQFSIERLAVEELVIEKRTGVECKLSVKNLEGKSIVYDILGRQIDVLYDNYIIGQNKVFIQ